MDGPEAEDTRDLVRRVEVDGVASRRFAELWERVAPALHAWASLRITAALRPRLDPDDLVQEVCCRAFLGFCNYDPERSRFRSWLFGIASHVLKSALVELGRNPSLTRAAAVDESTRFLDRVPDRATAVSRRIAADDAFRAFLALARDLDEEERRLLLHRGLEGLSHADVAARIGVTSAAARKRWERLRERLAGLAIACDWLAP